jgi:phage terminase large subunit-like protein
MSNANELVNTWREVGPIAWAVASYGWVGDDGRPIVLAPWQRSVLSAWWERRQDITTLAVSNIKKTGKTFVNAILLAWRWLALPSEHYAVGNDLDQSAGRQFQQIAEMVRRNAYLSRSCRVDKTRITFEPTGSTITALPADYAGASGANFITSSHTESWAILYENGVRMFEEMTPIPGAFYGLPCLRIVDSYAGYEGESKTWHDLVDRGLKGERVSDDWPIFQVGGLLLFHMDGEDAQARCFRGSPIEAAIYYAEQRASLRPNAYTRLHENKPVSGTEVFVTSEQWDSCIMAGYVCPLPDRSIVLSVGVDLATKRDCAAVVSVYRRDGRVCLGPYRIWKPSPTVDLDVVEAYILQLARDYSISSLGADPYQAQQMLLHLGAAGIPAREFTQTVQNMTKAGGALFDVIRQRQLAVYAGADDLRRHVLNASARETERGIRLVKQTASKKIDASIALAISVVDATDDSGLSVPRELLASAVDANVQELFAEVTP